MYITGHKGYVLSLVVPGPEGFEPKYYSILLFYRDVKAFGISNSGFQTRIFFSLRPCIALSLDKPDPVDARP